MPFDKRITFFHSDLIEKQTVAPVAALAAAAGYEVSFTEDPRQTAEIGVYCQHRAYPSNARLSIVMLHDMAQGHNRWPNFWAGEPWHEYDVGIVPGDSWAERWQTCSMDPRACPRLGVFNLGWPKADVLFAPGFRAGITSLREKLGLRHRQAILYAPSWEYGGRQDEFVRAFKDLPVDLLLKQAPWPDSYPQVLAAIREMNALHRGLADNVHVIDPVLGIMQCLALSDVIVSEESSVLVEALLLDVPGVAVKDWLVPDTVPARPASVPYDFAIKIERSALGATVREILENPARHREALAQFRARHFTRLGDSAPAVFDLIDRLRQGQRDGLPGRVDPTPGMIASRAGTQARFQFFWNVGNGFLRDRSVRHAVPLGQRTRVVLSIPGHAGPLRFRVDPCNQPGTVIIHEVVARPRPDGPVSWSLHDREGFSLLQVGGTATRVDDGESFTLRSSGDDPYVLLPVMEGDGQPVQLEISLGVHAA